MSAATTTLDDPYAAAFSRFGGSCLWSKSPVRVPTVQYARIVADTLRIEGGREAYVLAREIEEVCDAADRASD